MTTIAVARPRVTSTPRAAVGHLARLEARRMLLHPAPWLGLVMTVWFGSQVFEQNWSSAHYEGLVASLTPLLLGVSVASISTFAREHTMVSEEAPVSGPQRSVARLLAGLSLVALVAVVIVAGAVWLRARGGLMLGDEPGRTQHAHYSAPELLQPVLLAAFAVALGAALAHLLRHRLVASIVAFVTWFLFGLTYWLFELPVLSWLTPVQVQPVSVEVGPADADPSTFPATWLLSASGEFQDHWARVVVSPALAGWHDVYLVALTTLLGAAAVPGRFRRPVVAAALLVGAGAVLMQRAVMP
jgi:hypothetical protein